MKKLKMILSTVQGLAKEKFNQLTLTSGAFAYLVDFVNSIFQQVQGTTPGTWVAVLLFFGTGVFNLLKLRESWLKDRLRTKDLERKLDLEFEKLKAAE